MASESKTSLFRKGALTLEGVHPVSRRYQDLLGQLAEAAADDDITVFLAGETGTGKTMIAQAVHNASSRKGKTFLPFDASSEESTIMRSTLFGHEKEAYTGADSKTNGVFQDARGGTLFLDEITDLSWELQGAIRHAVDYRMVRRAGGTRPEPVDVRLVCATNVPLARIEKETGVWREDLFMRLRQAVFEMPPLREVTEEIPGIVKSLVEERTIGRGKPKVEVSDRAIAALLQYPWPGNIRELKHTVRTALVRARNGVLLASDLRFRSKGWTGGADRRTMRERSDEWAYQVWLQCERNWAEAARILDVHTQTLREHVARWEKRSSAIGSEDEQERQSA